MMNEKKFAVLIDAENEPNHIEGLLKKLLKRGAVLYRRIYGKTTITKAKWQGYENLGLKIVAHSSDKQNATDLYLCIDAMDILHKNRPDAICIVAGDKDYIPLINAIRENGVYCIIAARSKSMCANLQNVCDEIILLDEPSEKPAAQETKATVKEDKTNEFDEKLFVKKAKERLSTTKQEMNMARLCQEIYKTKEWKERCGDIKLGKNGAAKKFFEKYSTVFKVITNTKGTYIELQKSK